MVSKELLTWSEIADFMNRLPPNDLQIFSTNVFRAPAADKAYYPNESWHSLDETWKEAQGWKRQRKERLQEKRHAERKGKSTGNGKKDSKGKDVTCHNCGKASHMTKRCWTKTVQKLEDQSRMQFSPTSGRSIPSNTSSSLTSATAYADNQSKSRWSHFSRKISLQRNPILQSRKGSNQIYTSIERVWSGFWIAQVK